MRDLGLADNKTRGFSAVVGAITALWMCGWPGAPVSAQDAVSRANPPVGAEFRSL
jgi:hypothetical protein